MRTYNRYRDLWYQRREEYLADPTVHKHERFLLIDKMFNRFREITFKVGFKEYLP